MPFVTEEIYLKMPHDKESMCLERWPERIEHLPSADLEGMDRLISVIQKIREVKIANDLKPSAHLDILIKDLDGNIVPVNATQAAMVERLAKVSWKNELSGDLSVHTVRSGSLFIPSAQLMDVEAEKTKLNAEKARLENEVKRSKGILSNQGFLAKAPKAKIETEEKKLADYEKQLNVVLTRLSELG